MRPAKPRRQRTEKQLPAGRHGLPRSFVVSNQRERILDAVAVETSAKGYAATSVSDVCRTAGVSRRTFYDHFSNKEDAFLASYDAIAGQLMEKVGEAHDSTEDAIERTRVTLSAFLSFVASEPAFARMCIVEVLAAGQPGLERRGAAMRAFTQLILQTVTEVLPAEEQPPPLVAETIVGGIYDVVYTRVQQEGTIELPDLLPELMFCILAPYLGLRAAHLVLDDVRAA